MTDLWRLTVTLKSSRPGSRLRAEWSWSQSGSVQGRSTMSAVPEVMTATRGRRVSRKEKASALPVVERPKVFPLKQPFRAEVEAQGGVVLEPEWLGVNKPHHVLCAMQHHGHPTPGNVRAGHGICGKCSYRDRNAASKRRSEKAFEANVRAQGGTVLEPEYRGAYTRHLMWTDLRWAKSQRRQHS